MNYHKWEEPSSWQFKDDDNPAIPYLERRPCVYDDAIFPKGIKSAVDVSDLIANVKINSLKLGNDYFTENDLVDFVQTEEGYNMFYYDFSEVPIEIESNTCQDESGCICGNSQESCFLNVENQPMHCLNPVQPINFCGEAICGAHILLIPQKGFKIKIIKEFLSNYDVDTHVSKVLNDSKAIIQIVITEKVFTGDSLQSARNIFEHIKENGDKYKVKDVELYLSGPYYKEGEAARSALSLMFGTLVAVLLLLAILFMVYENNNQYIRDLRTRFNNSGSRPLSTYVFARYDNREDTGLIFGDQSLAGSVLSLDKSSFDNPLYGKTSVPSTSYDNDSQSMTLVGTSQKDSDSVKSKTISTGTEHENPMYENNVDRQINHSNKSQALTVDAADIVVEEGQLIEDLN